jgi:hypothetical protein
MFCEECGEALKRVQELYTLTVQAFPHLKSESPGRAFARIVIYAVAACGTDAQNVCAEIRSKFLKEEETKEDVGRVNT